MNEPDRAKIPQLGGRVHFRIWALVVVLGLMTIWLYWPVTSHDFVNYDDNVYVTKNLRVQAGLTPENVKWAFSHSVCSNWHPLTMLTHMLDCQLYGLRSQGHHLTNVLLHALDTILLFLLLHRLTGTTWRSAMVAALFACHPLHVESVAWVAERKDVLSALFGFISLYFYTQYARYRGKESLETVRQLQNHLPWFSNSTNYCLAWLSLALGLMSKPMLVTWPFVMLLLDFWPLDRFKSETWRRLVIEKIPGFILIVAGSVTAYVVQSQTGATGAMKGLPLVMRCENAVVSYARYILKTFWPHDLAIFYPYSAHLSLLCVLLSAAVFCAVSVFAWTSRKHYPFFLTGWFWFMGTLVPVIGIVQVGVQAMADRYMYIPSIGLFILVIWGLHQLSRGWRYQVVTLSLAGAATIALCAALTRQQLGYWQNSETLFRHALSVTADNVVARTDLAVLLRDQGRVDEAITQFRAVARFQPDYVEARNDLGNLLARQGHTNEAVAELQDVIRRKPNYPDAHCSLGRILINEGRVEEAFAQYQEAARLQPNSPDAYYGLGHLLAQKGQTDDAIRQFQAAEDANSDDAQVYFEYGNLLVQKNQADDATRQFQTAIHLKPELSGAHDNLGKLLAARGQIDDATAQFQEAARVQPNDFEAHNNLGNVLAMKGQNDAATAQFQAAIRLKPDFADAHFNYGNLLAGAGQVPAAVAQFQEVTRLAPNDAEGHYKLGNLLIKQGQTDAAIQQFEDAIRLRPDYVDAHFNLGASYLKSNQYNDSISQFQIVTHLNSNLAPGHCLLGMALAGNGQKADAITEFQEAIRLKPDYALAHNKLGEAFEDTGHLDDAISQFQEAVRLRPDYSEAKTSLAHALEQKNGRPNP